MSADNPKALSRRCNKQTDNFANGVDFPLRYRQGRNPLLRSVLTSCLYHSTNVWNSSRGCLKALYHVACLTRRLPREAGRSNLPHEIEQNRPEGSSRKGMPWSSEEVDLLLKLRKDESRPWSEVTRLFWEQYPGRSSGAIQVFWSMNLNKKADYR